MYHLNLNQKDCQLQGLANPVFFKLISDSCVMGGEGPLKGTSKFPLFREMECGYLLLAHQISEDQNSFNLKLNRP